MKNFLLVILGLAIVGGLAWYFNKSYLSATTVNSVPTAPSSNNTLPNQTKTETMAFSKDKLVLAVQSSQGKGIISIAANGENQKNLFTDTNETNKVKTLDSLANAANEAPMILTNNSLAAVKLDGSGKVETLIDSLGSPPEISLSSDGQQVAFIAFSNAEVDYGYTLYLAGRSGSGLRGLVRNEKPMGSPVWSADSKKIYYLQDMDSQTALMKVDLATARPQSIYETGETIYSLGTSNGKLVLSQGASGKTESAIYQMDDSGQTPQKILTEQGIIYFPVISSDNVNLAYLLSADVSHEPSGEVWVASLDGKNKKDITKGIKILGWIK